MCGKEEQMLAKVEEKAMVQFLEKFDDNSFLIRFQDNVYKIGDEAPAFTVNFKKEIPMLYIPLSLLTFILSPYSLVHFSHLPVFSCLM